MSLRRWAEDVCNNEKTAHNWTVFSLVLPKGPFWGLYPKVIFDSASCGDDRESGA